LVAGKGFLRGSVRNDWEQETDCAVWLWMAGGSPYRGRCKAELPPSPVGFGRTKFQECVPKRELWNEINRWANRVTILNPNSTWWFHLR